MSDPYTRNLKFVRWKSFASLDFGFTEAHNVKAIMGNRNRYVLQIVTLNTNTFTYFLNYTDMTLLPGKYPAVYSLYWTYLWN